MMIETKTDERNEMLARLQEIQFMTVDLNLYLNTHPDDVRALNQYNYYAAQQMMLKNKYEQLYGPLSNFGTAFGKVPWNWIYEPWPWEN